MRKNLKVPILRCRSEFSFRAAYGPLERVAERLEDIDPGPTALVDTSGTWGHAMWHKAAGERAAYGAEFGIKDDPEVPGKPRAWVLAEDSRQFYNFTSSAPGKSQDFERAPGCIRFAGDALADPAFFDYVDLNHHSLTSMERSLDLANRTGKPLALAPINDYPFLEDAYKQLAWSDQERLTPQHILHPDELRAAYWALSDDEFNAALRGTMEVGERLFTGALPVAPIIQVEGDLRALVEAGRQQRLADGHIKAWTQDYQARMVNELKMIEAKKYDSYFIVVSDLVAWSKQHMLVGPARGSSAGSLVCYLLRITEVDPLVHSLLFERFIDVNRDDLPDIDIDFSDVRRHMAIEHLVDAYGEANVAKIGSINTLKPRSAIAHAGKRLGIPHGAAFNVTNVLVEYSSGDSRYGNALQDTLRGTDPGRTFMEDYPEAELMADLEGHASHSGVHAAGVIVSNEPVTDFCTVIDGVAQLDKKGAEILNLLKIDVLGLRTLGVIEDAGTVTAEELYHLDYADPEVLSVFNEKKFCGVFQFEGAAQRRVTVGVPIEKFEQIDHVTALARPGPFGGGATHTYIEIKAGRQQVEYTHPSMAEYLSDTLGVVLYQEQVMRIVRELGGFSWEDTSTIRKAMSGRKGAEFFNQHGERFIVGAKERGVPEQHAATIWNQICSFGAWGMNKSHTCSYAMISYWCAYMKRYHPLEYAAACLRNAKDDEQVVEMLRELIAEGIPYTPFDPDRSDASWSVKDGSLFGGFTNLVGIGPVKAKAYINKREEAPLTDEDKEKLAKLKVKFASVSPAHDRWGAIYADPEAHNIHGTVKEFAQLKDNENAVVICKLTRKDRRDQNEAVRLARRGGRMYKGESRFLDMFVVDDSIAKPVTARINPKLWGTFGQPLADKAIPGEDWFLIRGKWLEKFSMLSVTKIKPLNNEEIFN